MSGGASVFRADAHAILAREAGGRLVLESVLTGDESSASALAVYASGRMLREGAALAWGPDGAFLWADAPADAGDAALAACFESFAASCDWWRERVDELKSAHGAAAGGALPEAETIIRP